MLTEEAPKIHRISVSVTEPDHPAVTRRKEKQQKIIRVKSASKEEAMKLASKHYRNRGYLVHDVDHLEMIESVVSEEIKVGDKVHVGHSQKGGSGYRGIVTKIDGETVHFRSEEEGKFGPRTFKGKLSNTSKMNEEKEIEEAAEKAREVMADAFLEMGMDAVDEAAYQGKGNHKPGWMLRADPELAKKFKAIADRKKTQYKYAGKSVKEESQHIDEEAYDVYKDHRAMGYSHKDAMAKADEYQRKSDQHDINKHYHTQIHVDGRHYKSGDRTGGERGVQDAARHAVNIAKKTGKKVSLHMVHNGKKLAVAHLTDGKWKYEDLKEEAEQVEENNLGLRSLVSTDPKKQPFYKTQKGRDAAAKKNVPALKSAIKDTLGKHPKPILPEEAEQIDELSKNTLISYVGKAREKNIKDSAKNRLAGIETSLSDMDKASAKVSKRAKGIQTAYSKLNKEEVEHIEEGANIEYHVVIRHPQEGKRSVKISALTPTEAKEKAERDYPDHKVDKVRDPLEKHYFRGQDLNLPEEAKKKVVVKTNEPIGYKIADIGPGGKEYNIKTDKAWDKKLKKEETELTEALILNKQNKVHFGSDPDVKKFAKDYVKGHKHEYITSPKDKDHEAAHDFYSHYDSVETRRGFGGSGTRVYTCKNTGKKYEVDKVPNGKGFYGTDHHIRMMKESTDSIQEASRKLTTSERLERSMKRAGWDAEKARKNLEDTQKRFAGAEALAREVLAKRGIKV